MKPGGTKSEKIERQGEQKWGQGHQKWAKGHQKWAKRELKGAKSEPKGAKRQPRGPKREPKVSQRATKMHQKVDLRKRSRKWWKNCHRGKMKWEVFGAIFHQKSMNKSMRKSMPKKWWKLTKHRCENGTEIGAEFDNFRKPLSRQITFSEKGVPTQTIIFMQ